MAKYGNPYPTREAAEQKAAELNESVPSIPGLQITFDVARDPAGEGWNVVQRRRHLK